MMNGTIPIATSNSYSKICRYRSTRIREDITCLQPFLGTIFLSNNEEEDGLNTRVLSYTIKNLLWNTERVLKTYRIIEVVNI